MVIPIENEFRSLAKISKESILNLVALLNKDGSVRNIHVAVFTPAKDQHISELPLNTFHNIFHTAKDITDGQYLFLSPAGTMQYKLDYKGGSMAAEGRYTTNPGVGAVQTNGVRANSTCIDWFLITTYYYPDGSTAQTSEYVGTTCSDCDNGMYESLCQGGEGGGGIGYEYAKNYTKTWQVFYVNDSTSIYDTESFRVEDDTFVTGVTFGNPTITHQHTNSIFGYSNATGTMAFDWSWVKINRNTSITYSSNPDPVPYNGERTWTVPQIKN